MATSLAVPVAYITVLVTALIIFSRIYRKRRAAEKQAFEPWFPAHPTRDIYQTLLSSPSPVPDSLLKSALLIRATADVKRIWRLRDDKMALTNLHQRGLIGDETMARFEAAEKELEAEIVDVVQEANTFRQGWGQIVFATATEMAQSERTREVVLSIPKIKAEEDKRQARRRKYVPDSELPSNVTPSGTPGKPGLAANTLSAPDSASASRSASPSPAVVATPELGVSPIPAAAAAAAAAASTSSGSSSPSGTPSKMTPGKKKKGKK